MKIYSEGWERKYGGEQQRGKIYGGNKEEQIGDREVREKKDSGVDTRRRRKMKTNR